MKTFILSIYLILFSGFLIAQNYDLNYYIGQAKANSPLINKNKNKLIKLDLQQINQILSKPVVNVEADVLFAPIISHDNNSNRFEWVSAGANNYTGYDLAISNGRQYQAFVSVTQPLFAGSIYKSFSKKAEISNLVNENNIALTNHEIEQLVSHQYILCLKSKNQSKISLALINELGRQLQILRKLVEEAIYKQTDLLLLQIEYQNYKLQYKTFQAEYKTNLLDLNLICGINDTNVVDVQEIRFELKSSNLTRIISVDQRIAVTEKQLKEYNKLFDLYKLELSQAQVSVMDLKNLFRDIAAKKQENMLLKMEKQALINSYNYWNY